MRTRLVSYAYLAGALVLPVVLLSSSLRTFAELERMKTVYLRNRAAMLSARLETIDLARAAEVLGAEERDFLGLRIFTDASAKEDRVNVEPLWQGRELFRTAQVQVDGVEAFRAYVPFHSLGRLHIARIDLAASGADFLVEHARRNVIVATLSGIALIALSAYIIWSIRQRVEEERRQSKLEHLAQLGEMAAVLAHEIRSPLGTIKGFAQLASEKNPEAAGLLEPVLDETRRLEKLVNDLLLYARPPSPAVSPIEWNEIARALRLEVPDARLHVEAANLTFETDPELVRRILVNLVWNGLEAIGEPPAAGQAAAPVAANLSPSAGPQPAVAPREVRIGASMNQDTIRIEVEDDGPGIPEELRAKVFDSFFTTKSSGTGLGLAIARRLASSLGGTLELSAGSSGGTRAVVTLSNGKPGTVTA